MIEKLIFQNGAEIEFSPDDTREKIRGYNAPIIWETPWTEEQMQRMHAYFLHDKRNGASLCLICTAKDNWFATWWKKMIEQYEEDSTDDERGKE